MALTKVTGQVVNTSTDLTVGVLTATTASFTGNVSVGGTLTYEDVTNVDSVGLITARNGIEVTDKGVQVGTGATVDSAAANTLTFLTNGSERVRVTSGGNIGIGTASPTAPLAVMSSSDPEIRFGYSETQDHKISWDSSKVFLEADPDNANGSSALGFKVDGTEAARFDSSGNFGIGEDSPAADLVVKQSGNTFTTQSQTVALFQRSSTTGHSSKIAIVGGNAATSDINFGDTDDEDIGLIQYVHTDNSLRITTNTSERLRIDSSGNFGLGTTSPSALLHISKQVNSGDVGLIIQNTGTSNNTASIRLNKGSGSEPDHRIQNDTGGNLTFARGTDESSYTEQMRIDSSGNVQVSTGQFTVGTTASTGLQLINDGTFGTIQSADLKIRTAATERLRISSDGPHLLLGGTADVNEITESSSNTGMVIGSTSVGNGGLAIINSTSGTGRIYFGDATGSDAARNRGQINYYHNGDYMMFATAGSERLRIDSSGRVFIDTTADRPIEMPFGNAVNSAQPGKLVIEDSGAGHLNMIIARENQSNAYGPAISLVKSRGTSDGSYTVVQSGDNLGTIQFGGADGSADRVGAAIVTQVDSTPGSDDMPGRLMFATTADGSGHPTERMRIDRHGFQASTSTNNGIEMGITAGASDLKIIFRGRYAATAGSYATGTISFNVWANGDVQNINNSYTAISDITLKENIVPASSQWDNIKDIEVVNYNFREETGYQTHRQLGVIAQQVEEVSPGLVKDVEEGLKTVNYSVLYMKAIKALQEAQTRIESLEARLDAGGL